MAYRLADAYAGRLIHVHGLGWHVFDGRRWIEDTRGAAKRAVLDVLRQALGASLGDIDLRQDVRRCESAAGVAGVLDLAAALPPFARTVDDLDADPYLLNCANGTLDLRTMELRPHDPRDGITKCARGTWRPDDHGARWPSFLEQVLPDPEVRAFLQRLVGVALLGVVQEQVLAVLTGTGANGKSVLTGALGYALGDYAAVAEPDLFLHREGAHPTGELDLRGVRWVTVSESDQGRRLAEATVKRLTGGDPIKARRMRRDFVTFAPSHTPALVTNHLPKVSGDDPALWRRLRVIPFAVVVPPAERDSKLAEALQLDADAVLSWAVAGWRDYTAARGLDEPSAVLVATEQWQRESDALTRFLDACCLRNPHMNATTTDLFDRWQRWAVEDGADPVSRKAFGQALDRLGYPTMKTTGGRRVRNGLGLLADDETDA